MTKVMKLIVPSTGLMKCKVCGLEHIAQLQEGGHFKRSSWQCRNGCIIEKKQSDKMKKTKINELSILNQSGINHFKFRAECIADVLKLKERLGGRCLKMIMEIEQFPDTVVDLYTTMSLDDLRNEIRSIEDGHVMLQTIALEKDYTGKRDYELE